MVSAFILALCAFPTTFDALWKFAAFCGVALIVMASILFWRQRALKHLGMAVLTGAMLVGGIWSLVLAFFTSRNYLVCAGVPGAPPELVRLANESYQTLSTFSAVVGATCGLTVLLVLISVLGLTFAQPSNERRKKA